MNKLSKVLVSNPPNMTCAIGLCISLPGKSLPKANGMSAKPELSAVINIGNKRSTEPRIITSCRDNPRRANSL